MYRVWGFVTNYSLLMIAGAVIALIWANINPEGYHAVVEWELLRNPLVGDAVPEGGRALTLGFLSKEVLMAFFFAIAAKEVWEALVLKGGALRGRKALVPAMSAAGGMIGPMIVYLGIVAVLGPEKWSALAQGWAVPAATDIAFSYLVARVIFGAGHPAVRYLLMLAIIDDALGLIILAVFYPQGDFAPAWLLLSLGAALAVFLLCNWLPRRMDRAREGKPASGWVERRLGLWPYAVAGALSWYGFQMAGIHPALGLIPIVPALPHADLDFGIYAEETGTDLLNRAEHLLKAPVEVILFLFGLLNAGVSVGSVGAATWAVLVGLLIGKPVGIAALGWLGARAMRLGLPEGMAMRDVVVVGFVAAIGFTVALFVAGVAFAPEASLGGVPVQEAAKLGALLSVVAGPIAFVVGRAMGVRRVA